MVFRCSKIALVAAAGLFALLVGWTNIADYEANFAFVQHVLAMDTVFEGNPLAAGRAITSEPLHHAAYWLIIAAELLTGFLCLAGALAMALAADDTARAFHHSKRLAVAGLTLGFLTWFTGFMTIGAEWFLMWQSDIWNGQQAAFRFIVCLGLVLVNLVMEDRELEA